MSQELGPGSEGNEVVNLGEDQKQGHPHHDLGGYQGDQHQQIGRPHPYSSPPRQTERKGHSYRSRDEHGQDGQREALAERKPERGVVHTPTLRQPDHQRTSEWKTPARCFSTYPN